MRPFKALAIVGLAALLAAVAVVVVPETLPNLAAGVRERPESPALVMACWTAATTASITGKRALAAGALSWRAAAAAHVLGTVSNRIVPAGAGAGGTYLIALRRGGMTLSAATAMTALWAVASGIAHASGALVAVAWLHWGVAGVAAAAAGIAVVGWRARSYLGRRAGAATDLQPPRRGRDGRLRRTSRALRRSIAGAVAVVRADPRRATAAVLAQAGAMSCLAAGFVIATSSFGVPVPMTTAIAAYLAATALSATIPTPAGIGSADAALVGALVMVGSPLNDAIPAVLVFRAVILLAPVVVAAVMAIGWTTRLWPRREEVPVVS